MSAEASVVFWLGLLLIAGAFLFIMSRGARKGAGPTDHHATALTQILHDDWDGALMSLHRATLSGQTKPDVYIKLGSLLRRRGDHARALQVHQTLTVRQDLTPDERATVLRCLAQDYRALGRRRDALQVWLQLDQESRDGQVWREVVQDAVQVGDYAAAEKALRQARTEGSVSREDLARFLADIGERRMQQGQTAEAKRAFQEALKENDPCVPALLRLGDLAYDEGDQESALYYWQKLAFASGDVPDLYSRLEKVYFDLGKFGDMERVYGQILEKRPRDVQALLAAARLARKKGNLDDAERLLRLAWENQPAAPEAFQLLAHLLLEQGKNDAARDVIDAHVKQLQPGRPS